VEGFVGECGSNFMSEEGGEEYCGKQWRGWCQGKFWTK
jgi:hypothetical protein